jgi:hypothetical protein
MQELLQYIDLDCYRSTLLAVARANLERLRQERSTCAALESRGKIPLGAPSGADSETSATLP